MPEQTTPGVRTAKLRVPAVEIDSGDPIIGLIFRVMQDRGAGPLHIHRVLANAPLAYQGFSTFAAALRGPGATPRTDRELAILLTALLKDSSYEFVQHRRIGLSVGLTPQQIDSLTDWREAGCYSPRQQLILGGGVPAAGIGGGGGGAHELTVPHTPWGYLLRSG